MQVNIFLAITTSLIIALIAYKKRSLSPSGFWGAILVGTVIISFGGWLWFSLLAIFFISSSLLSRYRRYEKEETAKKFAKGETRDLAQTLANGGLGAALAIFSALFASPLWFGAYLGAMATVNADTWATELGILSRKTPRLITNGDRVPPGTSGGITRAGFLASVAASLLIGFTALVGLFIQTANFKNHFWVIGAALLGGTLGALLDSFLGATRQAMYYCEICGKEIEIPVHSCGNNTVKIRGFNWLNNDGVNLASSFFGAMLGALGGVIWG